MELISKIPPYRAESRLEEQTAQTAPIEPPAIHEAQPEFARALRSLQVARIRSGSPLHRRELHRAIERFALSPRLAIELETAAAELDLLSLTDGDEDPERSESAIEDLDLVGVLFRDMKENKLLTSREHRELARTIEHGNAARESLGTDSGSRQAALERLSGEGQAAYDRFVACNLRLVVSVAMHYMHHGLDFLDLIQEGALGLMRAVKKWDPDHGTEFSTYAVYWIRQAITRAIADTGRAIRLPVHVHETISAIRKAKRQLAVRLGREPSYREIAEHLAITVEKVAAYSHLADPIVSLDAAVGESREATLEEFIPASSENTVEDEVIERERSGLVKNLIEEVLTKREADVITRRFALNGGRPMTLEDIGDRYGVTRERIRQIEDKALRRLRSRITQSRLKDALAS